MFYKWKGWCLWGLVLLALPAKAEVITSVGYVLANDLNKPYSVSLGYTYKAIAGSYQYYHGMNIYSVTVNLLHSTTDSFKFNVGGMYTDKKLPEYVGTYGNFVLEAEWVVSKHWSVPFTHYSHGRKFGIRTEEDNMGINMVQVRYHW